MLKVLKRLIEPSEILLKKYSKQVKIINSLESNYSILTDEELKQQFNAYSRAEKNNDTLFNIFAITREASKRVLGMRHYDVQIIGGLVLNEGNIAEMKTGEGKTLVSTCPAIYNALDDKKVHIITVNEYLAKRDYELNKPLFDFLGVKSAYISGDMGSFQKKIAYNASIIYGTNSEFGFDYLRDNMSSDYNDVLQKRLDFAIVDEVDSVLIDEARTPLIISGASDIDTGFLRVTNALMSFMKKGIDFEIDAKTEQTFLTEKGMDKAEKFLGIENLYTSENSPVVHYIAQSLKAHYAMKKDKDYIVRDGKVEIIDQFTGRISEGRRYSNSLHQAIEVKEKVDVKDETITKATITYQNYFRLYNKLSGMTGTAYTEKEELLKVYNMTTIVIPTNKPVKRIDNNDLIFPTFEDKVRAILKKVKEIHTTGQPILIGTPSIKESEIFDKALTDAGITHNTLNAKNHESEAEIIEQAGQKFSVTIATNMAGRGTDIKLGEGVESLGGLYVIGTSKNENRRIDNQLRGRSGRQGDKGTTQFYLSLEDELMLRFGADRMKKTIINDADIKENGIGSKFLTKIFDNAQKNLEGMNADSRKNILEFDSVLANRRKIIYKERTDLLLSEKTLEEYLSIIENFIMNSSVERLEKLAIDIWGEVISEINRELVFKRVVADIHKFTNNINSSFLNNSIKQILLSSIDKNWISYLDTLDNIRKGIHLQSYGQQNPLYTYEKRSEEEFEMMKDAFDEFVTLETYYFLKNTHENLIFKQKEDENFE